MSTFSKLSLVAQYDDMCRLVNKLVKDAAQEEEEAIAMMESVQKRWANREAAHNREKDDLRGEIGSLTREYKKITRQLAEARKALAREAEDKKLVTREKKALLEQIRQVRQLVESKDGLDNNDAHRRRVIKCLDVERLSPIQSDDSDDCVSGLDYDRTEDDILENERSRRSNVFDEILDDLPTNDQQLYRSQGKSNDNQPELRRSSRRSGNAQQLTSHATETNNHASNTKNRDKFADIAMDTDSNGQDTDDNDIEYVRQQLQKYEAEKKEKLASGTSTPNVRNQNKGATLSAKSAADLMKTISATHTPLPNSQKLHLFFGKKSFKPDCRCGPCGGKISFYGSVYKCEHCGVICHPECKEKAPLPCVKITGPNTRSRSKKILISDYVNSDSVPKVPALIVHCCNEIEREDNIITEGLYRVVSRSQDIEDLQQRILKSKSGMPNLSTVNVHLLTGVVKRFLQSLDESLVTTTMWCHFAEAIRLDSHIEACTHMSYYINYDLPTANRDTLAYMMLHLHAIAKHSAKNLMTITSLAKTLAPTIVGNSVRKPPQSTIQIENKTQTQIMETLLKIDEDFWEKFVQKSSIPPRTAHTLGSRLLGSTPETSNGPKTRSSRHETLPTPKLKPLFK